MSTLELSTPEPGIALLTLSRPERLNAMSAELLAELHRTLDAVAEDPGAGSSSSPARDAGSA